MNIFPSQKVDTRTPEWWKGCTDFLADSTDFFNQHKSEHLMLYAAAEGRLQPSQYKYVLNPYNTEDENLKNYPAMMRNFDIISPVIGVFMGEMADRTMNDEVIVTNADVINRFEEDFNKQMLGLAAQDFVNQLNAAGQNTGVPTEELPEYQEFVEEYKENWNDQRAIFGQEALNYIRYNCDLKDKLQDAFYDWLVTGTCYSYKEPRDKDVFYEIVPTYELWHGHSSTNFIEDANYAVRRFRKSPTAIVDQFRHYLEPEDIDWLENLAKNGIPSSIIATTPIIDGIGSNRTPAFFDDELGLVDVFHCTWKGFKQVYILLYIDELGKQQELEVDKDYELDKAHGDIEIVKEWVSEVLESYRIDKHLYLKSQPILAQRSELNNSSICKLPYNGRIGYNKHTTTSSVVRKLLNHQALYNIYHYRGELTLARNKDRIMTMPLGLIPEGWSPEKALWFAETTGIMWFDETKPNAASVLSAIKSVDMSLGNYVEQMRELLREIKDEAWDSIGMNRQRYGDSKASDGKGVSEQAVIRSATISREMFRRFEKFAETDKQGLLDISKVAWIDGKKSMYVTSDGRKKFFEVNGVEHLESDYGVFAKDSSEEQAKLNAAKGLTNMMAQKGGVGASLMFETLDANNFSTLKKYARKFEDIQMELEQKAAKAEQENSQLLQDKINAKATQDNETKIKVAEIQAGAVLQSAQIKAHTDVTTTAMSNQSDSQEDNGQNENPILSELLKAKADKDKVALTATKNNQDAINQDRDLSLKDKKIDADIKIAKQNKNKYDK